MQTQNTSRLHFQPPAGKELCGSFGEFALSDEGLQQKDIDVIAQGSMKEYFKQIKQGCVVRALCIGLPVFLLTSFLCFGVIYSFLNSSSAFTGCAVFSAIYILGSLIVATVQQKRKEIRQEYEFGYYYYDLKLLSCGQDVVDEKSVQAYKKLADAFKKHAKIAYILLAIVAVVLNVAGVVFMHRYVGQETAVWMSLVAALGLLCSAICLGLSFIFLGIDKFDKIQHNACPSCKRVNTYYLDHESDSKYGEKDAVTSEYSNRAYSYHAGDIYDSKGQHVASVSGTGYHTTYKIGTEYQSKRHYICACCGHETTKDYSTLVGVHFKTD